MSAEVKTTVEVAEECTPITVTQLVSVSKLVSAIPIFLNHYLYINHIRTPKGNN